LNNSINVNLQMRTIKQVIMVNLAAHKCSSLGT
jgi:hypothetical protein